MPGQEYGRAIADVLFGDVPSSGRLPFTMPAHANQMPFTQEQWPGVPGDSLIDAQLHLHVAMLNLSSQASKVQHCLTDSNKTEDCSDRESALDLTSCAAYRGMGRSPGL